MGLKWHPFNPLSANPIKWSNTLKKFVGNLPTNCLSVFDHFVGLAFKGLTLALGGRCLCGAVLCGRNGSLG